MKKTQNVFLSFSFPHITTLAE